MNFNQFGNLDIVEELLEAIEEDYGARIERIVKCEELVGKSAFLLTVVFTDYVVLEAKVKVSESLALPFNKIVPSLQVQGTYY